MDDEFDPILSRYAVIYIRGDNGSRDDFICHAEDHMHAEDVFREFYPEEKILRIDWLGEVF